jgi:hypothetical protein
MFDAESLPAISLCDLSKVISGYLPVMRRVELADLGDHPARDSRLKVNRLVAR